MLSIVIPSLNCRDALQRTLDDISLRPPEWEVVVVDGGSTDGTAVVAEVAGVRLIIGQRGRGAQMAAGGAAASKSWILFWHADTQPQPGWVPLVEAFMRNPENSFRAAYFRLALNDPHPSARRVERLANWRAKALGLPYGDQGLLISKKYYEHLGGFKNLTLMEDVDLVNRIGTKRLTQLETAAVTSAVRYQRDGWWARPAKNITCLCLYFLGIPVDMIARLYK